MHFNGEKWLRRLILLYAFVVSVSCLRGSQVILNASKAKPAEVDVKGNSTDAEGEVSGGEGANSTKSEKSHLTGIPQIDYIYDPNLPRELNGFNLSDYPFYNAVPKNIEFKCDGLHDGFYASVPHHCQVYHHCLFGTRYDFLCANYTAFDQKTFICHFVSEVDCVNSPKYYIRNEALYKQTPTTTLAPVKTTTTTPAPTKKPEEDGRRPGPYRQRRPPFRRRPAYEYYDNAEDYYDDYYYYGPPVRKRPNRNKGYRGDPYYGGERAGGVKSIHRDQAPRRKPLKPLYEDDDDYEYYYDSADGSRDDDEKRRPLDNNYKKPVDRERPYLNKKRDKENVRNSESGLRNDKKKRVEEQYSNSRKTDIFNSEERKGNKYSNKAFPHRSKLNRDNDRDQLDDSRKHESRNEEDRREKFQKSRPSESPKRITETEKPFRSKNQKSTTPSPEEEEYEDDVIVTPKWKSRFQPRRSSKDEDSKKKSETSKESSSEERDYSNERRVKSDRGRDTNTEKAAPVTESSTDLVSPNPQIYARQPSKLYTQVKAETRPPPRQSELYKSDLPATTMSSNYRRPLNSRSGAKDKAQAETERPKPSPKYQSTTATPEIEYEDEDVTNEDTGPAKSYYEDDVSDSYSNQQFPSRTGTTVPTPSRNYRDQSQSDTQLKSEQRSKGTSSSFNQRVKPVTERQQNPFLKQQQTERQPINPPPVTEKQYVQRQPFEESEALPYQRQQVTERQQYLYQKQPVSERQQIPFQRQPIVERQPLMYSKQPITERQLIYQKQPVTERQLIAFAKQPVTDRQIIPFQKQVITERQIIPYLRQAEAERKPIPFPKQPPRSFEITAPGPSGLGGRIEVSDSIPRAKYVIQGDRPTGFSIRLPQNEYSNPLQPTTQIQRRPEEPNVEKIATRPSFKPVVRNYRTKQTPEPQPQYESVRVDSFPQRYLQTDEYEVVPNSRLPVIPQIAHVSNSKEWYW